MEIHLFQDSLGHYSVSTCNRIHQINLKNNFNYKLEFINISNNHSCIKSNIITQLPENWRAIIKYLNNINDIEKIHFHNYNYISQHILFEFRKKSSQITFNWVFWSAEFYNLPEISKKNYIGKSYKYHPTYNFFRFLKFHFFHLRERIYGRPYYSHKKFIESFKEINFFFSFLRSDFDNVVNYSNAKLNYRLFSYLSFDQFFEINDKPRNIIYNNKDVIIMINHNGDPILNHFDVLERLVKINCKFKLVFPIAYGNTKYINNLKEYCFKNFDFGQIDFWDKFISPSEYSEKLLSINVAIFNFSVQKGIGNILPLLWNGTKLFLREECPIFIDFRKLGFCLFSIQNELTEDSLKKPLSYEEVTLNRKLLSSLLSEDSVNEYYKDCFFSPIN